MTGPVQVLVVGFDQPKFSGEVLAEFVRLREAGIVRLVDLLLISRTEEGTLETLEAPEAVAADLGGLAAEVLSQPEGGAAGEAAAAELDPAATWSLADAIPVGGTAAVALIEHLWAASVERGDPACRGHPARGDLAGPGGPRAARDFDR